MILAPLLLSLAGAASAAEPVNVVLVTLEATRPEHLSAYGYSRRTSPALEKIAARGLLFERAYAQAPWTLPSLASLFTSRYSEYDGVDIRHPVLAERQDTFVDLFNSKDYRTAAFVSGLPANAVFGLTRTFKDRMTYDDTGMMDRQVRAATDWIEEAPGQPFFIWLHAFESHLPYSCPAKFRESFDSDYRGPVHELAIERINHRSIPALDAFMKAYNGDPRPPDGEALSAEQKALIASIQRSPKDVAHFSAHYDGCLSWIDEQIGKLDEFLDEKGLRKSTVLIITADHGEYLGGAAWTDAPMISHPVGDLHQELLHVPLIVAGPGFSHGVSTAPARLLDIGPTIAAALGLAVPDQMQGGALAAAPSLIYSSDYAGARSTWVRAMRRGDWKLMWSNGTWQLFNLKDDPQERVDRLEHDPLVSVVLAGDFLEESLRASGGREPQ